MIEQIEIASQRDDLECGLSFSADEIQRERFPVKDQWNVLESPYSREHHTHFLTHGTYCNFKAGNIPSLNIPAPFPLSVFASLFHFEGPLWLNGGTW